MTIRPNPELIPFGSIRWNRVATDGSETSGAFNAADFGQYKYYRTWIGSRTSGYATMKKRQRLKLQTLDHSYTVWRSSGTPYDEKITNTYPNGTVTVSTYHIDNYIVAMSPPFVTHLDEAYTKARAQLASKVNAMSVNLAQAFGERKQTANLLANTASRIARAAIALKRGRLGDFQRALSSTVSQKSWAKAMKSPIDKRLANHWLEFQYGWKPLLQDAFGVAELLASHSQERYVTSNTGVGTASSASYSKNVAQNPGSLAGTRTKTKISVTYCLDSSSKAGLAQTGISNPALLAWELLPYSFVVDWFVPVGNYLEALNAFSGFQFVDGWQATKSQKDVVVFQAGTSAPVWNGSNYTTTFASGSGTYSIRKYDRVRLTSFPGVGNLTFKNPIGGEPLARLATAVSLLRVLFK